MPTITKPALLEALKAKLAENADLTAEELNAPTKVGVEVGEVLAEAAIKTLSAKTLKELHCPIGEDFQHHLEEVQDLMLHNKGENDEGPK